MALAKEVQTQTLQQKNLPIRDRREQLHGKPGEVPQWMKERQGRRSKPTTKEHQDFREVFNPLD